MARAKKEALLCGICGEELTDDNRVAASHVCLPCQSKIFEKLEMESGTHLAIFITCAACNVPCEPLACPKNIADEENRWEAYLDALEQKDKLFGKDDKPRTFFSGVTNIRRVFGKEMTETDFAKYVTMEQTRIDRLPGTQEQRDKWGVEPLWANIPMSDEVYNELDAQYDIRASSYAGITITPAMEDVLIKVSQYNVIMSHLRTAGKLGNIKEIQKIVDSMLASENMRKKDEKPAEAMRMDALVFALESMGAMEDGELLTYDELVDVLRDHHIKSQKYEYSLDVADQVILDVINSMRANADMEILTELPEEYSAEDEYGEFSEEETEKEKQAKQYIGITKASIKK